MGSGLKLKDNASKTARKFQYLGPGWAYITHAALRVFEENQREEDKRGIEASADVWSWMTDYREEYFRRTVVHWIATSKSSQPFPHSFDDVIGVFMKVRKRNQSERDQYRAEIDAALKPA